MGKELSLFSKEKKVPAFLAGADTSSSNDGVGIDDIAVPQLKILQPLSPELMMNIDGAKAGMFINSVTHELFDKIYVVNLMYEHNFGVFKIRDAGGGKIGQADSRAEAQEIIDVQTGNASDYQIVDTGVHRLLGLNADGTPNSPMIMYLSSTKKTTSQRWNTQIQLRCDEFNVPRFALVWELTSTAESNNKGSWYGFTMDFAGVVQDEDLYGKAKNIRESLEQMRGEQPRLEAS